jgi:TonB family protein
MCRLSIVSSIVLLCAGGFAFAQEKPTASQDSQPFLNRCSDTNPPPCADKAPAATEAPGPECSKEADKARINGTVVLTVVVGTDGLTHDVSVVKSVGYGLDEQAIEAVKKWKLKPGEASGKPAPVQVHVELEFHCPSANRNIGVEKDGKSLGNWYSLNAEKEMGKRYSAQLERDFKLMDDRAMTDYVARIADNVAKNSDAQLPITVRLLDSDQLQAITLPGGYQYITRGLLLQLENEAELASVLARGIAHTRLRSGLRLMTRAGWAKIAVPPTVGSGVESNILSGNFRGQIELVVPPVGSGVQPNIFSEVADPVRMMGLRRQLELEADYFGVQYVYKAGYNAESFVHLVERISPASGLSTKAQASSPFPPTPDRLKALRKEIAELPNQDGRTVSTPEFEDFRERLRAWRPKEPVPTPTGEKPLPRE